MVPFKDRNCETVKIGGKVWFDLLSLDPSFSLYLSYDARWAKKSPKTKLLTAQQKSTKLDLMLGQIVNYCPVISRNVIEKNSTSLEQSWQSIRLNFPFQSSGAYFLDFIIDISLHQDERPEDLYQRPLAFIYDNLLKREGRITHHWVSIDDNEKNVTCSGEPNCSYMASVNQPLADLTR